MKTVKDYNLPLNSLKHKQQHEKNKHCAILPRLCRHCQSKAKHSRIWAQAMIFLPIKQVDLWPSDLERGVRVTCDVDYLCANFSLPRPLCSQLRPDVRDRETDRRQTDVSRVPPLFQHWISMTFTWPKMKIHDLSAQEIFPSKWYTNYECIPELVVTVPVRIG